MQCWTMEMIEILRVEKQNIEAENKRKSEFNSISKWKKKKKKREHLSLQILNYVSNKHLL